MLEGKGEKSQAGRSNYDFPHKSEVPKQLRRPEVATELFKQEAAKGEMESHEDM
jgi:hypothetical protein